MIIVCSYCGPPKVLGYKCPRCGGKSKYIRSTGQRDWFGCTDCGLPHIAEEGGTSHGICPEHRKELSLDALDDPTQQASISNDVSPCPDCDKKNLDCQTCKGWGWIWKEQLGKVEGK